MTTPKISIGLPVYNGENYLEAALKSILNQTWKDYELIISDNASDDRTEEICRDYASSDNRIRYHRNEQNFGAAQNFNQVFEMATAPYFQWAAHDDEYHPEFLEKSVPILDKDPAVVLVFSKVKFIDQNGNLIKEREYPFRVNSEKPMIRFFDLITPSTIVTEVFGLIRRDVLAQTPLIAGYAGSDRALLGRLALHGKFYQIPEFLFYHREHEERSAIKYRQLQTYTEWFVTKKAGKIVFPAWKIFSEHLKSIWKTPLSFMDRMKGYLGMVKWMIKKRRLLFNDLYIAAHQLFHRKKVEEKREAKA